MCYACFIHRKVVNHCLHDFVKSRTPQTNNFSEAVFLVLTLDSVQHTKCIREARRPEPVRGGKPTFSSFYSAWTTQP